MTLLFQIDCLSMDNKLPFLSRELIEFLRDELGIDLSHLSETEYGIEMKVFKIYEPVASLENISRFNLSKEDVEEIQKN